MRSNDSFGVHFILRESTKLDGKMPIYLRIVINQRRCEVSLRLYVKKEDWSEAKGAAKPKNAALRKINYYLEESRAKVVSHYQEIYRSDQPVSAAAVKNAYLGIVAVDKKVKYSLMWLVEQHNTHMEKILQPGSLKNYFTTAKYIRVFLEKQYAVKDIFLNELKYEFITAFEFFIRNTPIKKNDPCTNNGTMKHLERLKKMVSWAAKNEWVEKNPFLNYQVKFKHKERDYLSENEIVLLEQVQLSNAMLHKVRDMFVFSCYTGLAFADLMELQPHQIVTNGNGSRWIKTSRAKNDIGVNVPLLETAITIMEKFQREVAIPERETIFPKVSNQEMNRSLKVIAEICGIGKYLTFHLARHTFATTVTLMNGVPIESISKMLGHTKISTTMIYARVTQSKIGMDMEMLQTKLNQHKGINNKID